VTVRADGDNCVLTVVERSSTEGAFDSEIYIVAIKASDATYGQSERVRTKVRVQRVISAFIGKDVESGKCVAYNLNSRAMVNSTQGIGLFDHNSPSFGLNLSSSNTEINNFCVNTVGNDTYISQRGSSSPFVYIDENGQTWSGASVLKVVNNNTVKLVLVSNSDGTSRAVDVNIFSDESNSGLTKTEGLSHNPNGQYGENTFTDCKRYNSDNNGSITLTQCKIGGEYIPVR
jgi:hypothetical protein